MASYKRMGHPGPWRQLNSKFRNVKRNIRRIRRPHNLLRPKRQQQRTPSKRNENLQLHQHHHFPSLPKTIPERFPLHASESLSSTTLHSPQLLQRYVSLIRWQDDWFNEFAIAHGRDDFRFLYLGEDGSFTSLHHDVNMSHSWSTSLCGIETLRGLMKVLRSGSLFRRNMRSTFITKRVIYLRQSIRTMLRFLRFIVRGNML